jgi:hypothetical protein
MYKTASQIAESVLHKYALSLGTLNKAWPKMVSKAQSIAGSAVEGTRQALKKYPRTADLVSKGNLGPGSVVSAAPNLSRTTRSIAEEAAKHAYAQGAEEEGPGIGRPIGMGIGGAALGGAGGAGLAVNRLAKSKLLNRMSMFGADVSQMNPRWMSVAKGMTKRKMGRGALIGGAIGTGLGALSMLSGRRNAQQEQQAY